MTEVMMGKYVSVIVSVAEEKTKGKKSLPWFLGVMRRNVGRVGRALPRHG